MSFIERTAEWLLHAGVAGFALLMIGSIAVVCCRQPVRRIRLITLTLAACLVAPLVALVPGLPKWSLRLPPLSKGGPGGVAALPAPTEQTDRISDLGLPTADLNGAHEAATLSPPLGKGGPGGVAARGTSTEQAEGIADLGLRIADREKAGEAENFPATFRDEGEIAPSSPPLSKGGLGGVAAFGTPTEQAEPIASPQFEIRNFLPIIYITGIALLSAWWLAGLVALCRVLRGARPAPEWCRQMLRELAGPQSDRARLVVSQRITQPFTCTWRQPVIVLPAELVAGDRACRATDRNGHELPCAADGRQLGRPQRRAAPLTWVLAHEWSHVARGDARLWTFAGLVRVACWYQPLVWWLRRELRLCQDYLADAAAAGTSPSDLYAEFLATRALGRPLALGLGITAGRSDLYRRIKMLVKTRRVMERRCPWSWTAAVFSVALGLVLATAMFGERPAAVKASPASLTDIEEGKSSAPEVEDLVSPALLAERDAGAQDDIFDVPIATDPANAEKQKLVEGLLATLAAPQWGRVSYSEHVTTNWPGGKITTSSFGPSDLYFSGDAMLRRHKIIGGVTRHLYRDDRVLALEEPSADGYLDPEVDFSDEPQTAIPTRLRVRLLERTVGKPLGHFLLRFGDLAIREFLKGNAAKVFWAKAHRINGITTQGLEWTLSTKRAQRIVPQVDGTPWTGGSLRFYVAPQLGHAVVQIEYIDRTGTRLQIDYNDLRPAGPQLPFVPGDIVLQVFPDPERKENLQFVQLVKIESFEVPVQDEVEGWLILEFPAGTHVLDERSHRGDVLDARGSVVSYDKARYPNREFITRVAYPFSLPADQLGEMDRDVLTREEWEQKKAAINAPRHGNKPAGQSQRPNDEDSIVPRYSTWADLAAAASSSQPAATDSVVSHSRPDTKPVAGAAASEKQATRKQDLRYNGESFGEWRKELLNELSPNGRIKALEALGAFGANGYGEEAAAAIVEVLKSDEAQRDMTLHENGCRALSRCGAAGIAGLEAQLSSRSAECRKNAVWIGLHRLAEKSDAVVPALLKAAKDQNRDVRALACGTLARLHPTADGVYEVLATAMHEDNQIRYRIVDGLAQSAPSAIERCAPLLLGALESGSLEERYTAALALAMRGPPDEEIPERVTRCLLDTHIDARSNFVMRLRERGENGERFVASIAVPVLVAILEAESTYSGGNGSTQVWALEALRYMPLDAAGKGLSVLTKAVEGKLPGDTGQMRLAALDALAMYGSAAKEALPALIRLRGAAEPPNNRAWAGEFSPATWRSRLEAAILKISGKE
ncbi:MAG: M56 family metallopeptidase [Planctomycetaceae bacterium]